MDLQTILSQPVVTAVIGSVAAAVAIDWDAFRSFESFGDAKAYRWDLAAWRAFKGLVVGLVAGLTSVGLFGGAL